MKYIKNKLLLLKKAIEYETKNSKAKTSKRPPVNNFLFNFIFIVLVFCFFSTLAGKLNIFITVIVFFIWFTIIIYPAYKKEKYFASEPFLKQKEQSQDMIAEYNEIASYILNLNTDGSFKTNKEQYKHSHLAKYTNTSTFNINRNKNTKTLHSDNVYQTSLSVVKKASEEPIKYLTKYFNISTTDDTLQKLQETAENFARFNAAKENLTARQDKLANELNPPIFIKKYYMNEFLKRLEMNVPNITIDYPNYVFEYVSAGGNSSQRTTIKFDEETIEATAEFIANKLNNMKSAKYQRSLMTRKLREKIKNRDNHTCLECGISTREQSLLLLEVDHIIPVSKGGLSTEDNLQTLCWKCNRTKSDKLIS